MASYSATQGIAAQCFTLRDRMKEDWEGTLRELKKVGFKAAQISAMGHAPTDDLAKVLKELDFAVIGEHVGLNLLIDNLGEVIERARKIDCKWVFLPSLPGELQNIHGFKLIAEFLDALDSKLRAVDLVTGYHNHAFEFANVNDDGLDGYTILLDRLPPTVAMELDTYWVEVGGHEAAGYMSTHLVGRLPVLHVKDMAPGEEKRFAEIGQGTLNWPAIYEAADTCGTEWFVIEQDRCYDRDPMDSLAMSLDYLRKAGFAN